MSQPGAPFHRRRGARAWQTGPVLAVLCLVVAAPCFGQAISGGGKLGMAVASLESEAELDSTRKGGFAAGGFLDVALNGVFSIQPQVFVIQKGARITAFDGVLTLKLDYVEVPLLGVITFPSWGEIRPFVYGGPSVALRLSAATSRIGQDVDEDVSGDFKKTDAGVTFGGGINVDGFTLEARYTVGLVNVAANGPDLTTRAFVLVGGFSFPLPRR